MRRTRRRASACAVLAAAIATLLHACVEPPPKIATLPSSGLALRVFAFGASAEDARTAFGAVRQNNPSFSVVETGGDGEVLLGLENDSPKCVVPTALCSYKVSYRIRDNKGDVAHAATTTIHASSDRCGDLCSKALNNVVVKIVETAASVLKVGASDEASVAAGDGGSSGELGTSSAPGHGASAVDAGGAAARAVKKGPTSPIKAEAAKGQPALCSVGAGPRLAAEEAERRAAQVEVLKRLGVIDQDEYDCLRKAYLARL